MTIPSVIMNQVIKQFFYIVVSLLLLSGSAQAVTIKYITVFGDSLSDAQDLRYPDNCGNNEWLQSAGVDCAPIVNSPSKSGSQLWVNYLINRLDLSGGNIKPRRDVLNTSRGIVKRNVSYAFAGATTAKGYTDNDGELNLHCVEPGENCVPGVLEQVRLFIDENNGQHKKHARSYFIFAGANDIRNSLLGLSSDPQLPAILMDDVARQEMINSIVQEPVNQLREAASQLSQSLDGKKSQHIWVLNLPDLTHSPYIKTLLQEAPEGIIRDTVENFIKQLSAEFNSKLEKALNQLQLQTQLTNNSSNIHLYNLSKVVDNVMNDPATYNLENTDLDCVSSAATPSCNGYVWFNKFHVTTAMHKLFAKELHKNIRAGLLLKLDAKSNTYKPHLGADSSKI